MHRRKFITTTAAGIASVAVAGCTGLGSNGGSDGGGNQQQSPSGTDKNVDAQQGGFFEWGSDVQSEDALKVSNSRLVKTANGAGVLGDVTNTGNEVFTFVEVQATLYDESDDVLGEFFDNTEESSVDQLQPGETWDFEIFFENADLGKVARYSLSAKGETAATDDEGGAANGTSTGTGTRTASGTATGTSTGTPTDTQRN